MTFLAWFVIGAAAFSFFPSVSDKVALSCIRVLIIVNILVFGYGSSIAIQGEAVANEMDKATLLVSGDFEITSLVWDRSGNLEAVLIQPNSEEGQRQRLNALGKEVVTNRAPLSINVHDMEAFNRVFDGKRADFQQVSMLSRR